MWKTLTAIAKINTTVLGNKTIYNFRNVPILNKLFDETAYNEKILVIIAAIIGSIGKIFKMLFLNFFLFAILMMIPIILTSETNVSPLTGFLFIMLLIVFFTSKIFKASDGKYNVVFLMRLNAKYYAFIETIQYLFINLIIMILPLFIMLLFNTANETSIGGVTLFFSVLSFYTISTIFINMLMVFLYDKTKFILPDSKIYFLFIILLLASPIIMAIKGISISLKTFWLICLIILLLTISLIPWFIKTTAFTRLYKQKFSSYTAIVDTDAAYLKNFENQVKINTRVDKKIENKKGYDYFNSLFIARHRSILYDNALILTVFTAVIIGIVIVLTFFFSDIKEPITKFLSFNLPFIVEVMLFTNRGSQITQAMFFHCDHAMLQFNFYRNKKIILDLFNKRLMSIIKINLMPTLAMIIGLDVLYVMCGNYNLLNILGISLTIFMINIFFSIHYLGLYYLLQPYTEKMKEKNHTYNFIVGGTFIVLYYFVAELVMPTILFSTITVAFTAAYFVIMSYLVKKYSYKTFKIK